MGRILIGNVKGYTPQKGVDYWTDADKMEFEAIVSSKIAGIQIGGRNYAQESAFTNNTLWKFSQDPAGADVSYSLENGIMTLSGSDYCWKQYQIYSNQDAKVLNEVENGQTYTLSADVYVEEGAIGAITLSFRATLNSGVTNSPLLMETNVASLGAGKWSRIKVTGTVPDSIPDFSFWRVILCSNAIGTIKFRHPKLEKGIVSTDWTPAIEDFQMEAQNL